MRVWLGVRRDASVALPRLSPDLARLLLRVEEHERPERDRWGCWDFEASENYAAGQLWEPQIDRWVADRRAELAGSVDLEPLWPNGHAFAVCVTHDVDLLSPQATPRQALRHARAGLAPGADGDRRRLLRLARPPVRLARSLRALSHAPATNETLEASAYLVKQHGGVGSYFFTVLSRGERTRYDCVYAPADLCRFRGTPIRVADVMRMLAHEGFDVGLHGSYHSGLRPGLLAAERQVLQEATGLEITTTRQHFLRWDARVTPRLQSEAGFRADSSVGFNRNIGFRAGTSLPFRIFDVAAGRPLDLLEVPLVVQDGALLGPIGIGVDAEGASAVVEQLMRTVAAVGGALTVLFHPDKLVHDGWRALYRRTLQLAADNGAWLTSLRAVDEWWRAREAKLG